MPPLLEAWVDTRAPFPGGTLADFKDWSRTIRRTRIAERSERPLVRFQDGDYNYRGRSVGEISGTASIKLNDVAAHVITLPIDFDNPRSTYIAHWILDEESRGTRNVHISIDKNGGRIAGRLQKATCKRSEKGDVVVAEFFDDIYELKNVEIQPNPFLPAMLIQQPKVWFLFDKSIHGLKLTLMCNLLRLQLTNIDLGAFLDLLDPANWNAQQLLELWQECQIVVVPSAFLTDVSPPTLIMGAFTDFLTVAQPILEDAEQQIITWRWFEGDPEPWPGAGTGWRNGTLFVDIVDKSGYLTGTSFGGNLVTGLVRGIANYTSNYVEDSYDLFTGETTESTGYDIAGWLGTHKSKPYVIYRDGIVNGLQTADFTRTQGGACQITVGGRSMPGVNEVISAAINYGGDVLGDNINWQGYGIGSLGGLIDSVANPIYRDSILAYMQVPLLLRAHDQGWGHYLETTANGSMQAFTPSAVMALRGRKRETDPDVAFTLTVEDCSPWLIGDRGEGHWWLGDRVGATLKHLGANVYMSRCRQLDLSWGDGRDAAWQGHFGQVRTKQDALDKLTKLVGQAMSGLQTIGVLG
ncbi:hypothetical protein [Tsukamurella paurometabola]|uniref:Gp28/Gp37-like domain-containing protein n=1 Tax=Tsukamurella paurometabola TaxID=2061 RepID=A0A3P8KZ62_TSUPA|nr:hypothetical protein [Tsukamurella paurometabola]UEA84401.1 hypothetical protein LK411_06150 [Tsukamurella paurometabola]VDR36965.1 Uncharacterised protein [Tsukamurella paurometabola]